jgi:hypothetical protein
MVPESDFITVLGGACTGLHERFCTHNIHCSLNTHILKEVMRFLPHAPYHLLQDSKHESFPSYLWSSPAAVVAVAAAVLSEMYCLLEKAF